MSDDQKNPPAQPEFGELAPEGWSWNPEANAPHTPETLKVAEVAAKPAKSEKVETPAKSGTPAKTAKAVAVAKLASDRFITWGLLGIAVFSVITGLSDYVNLTRTLNAAFDQLNAMEPGLNLEPYANLGLAKVLGWGIVLAQAVVIGLTFWWAIHRMRADKMAFWVPVVGFAISGTVVLIFMILAFVADPAAWNAILTYIQNSPAATPSGQSS